MTIVTIEIDNGKDISDLKRYLSAEGFKFDIDEQTEVGYSDEFKLMLNERYEEYVTGKAKIVSSQESKERIARILAGEKLK